MVPPAFARARQAWAKHLPLPTMRRYSLIQSGRTIRRGLQRTTKQGAWGYLKLVFFLHVKALIPAEIVDLVIIDKIGVDL